MNKISMSLLGAVMLCSGCAAQVQNLEQFNHALAEKLANTSSGVGFSQNAMAPQISSSFQAKLLPPTNDAAIAANWVSAKPLVEKILGLAACGVGPYNNNPGMNEIEAWKSLGRWVDPDTKDSLTYGHFPLAIWHTQYHPKSSCMNILRIDKWAKPSKNTLAFRVQFVSNASDETVQINYVFKMIDDNTWVYNQANL